MFSLPPPPRTCYPPHAPIDWRYARSLNATALFMIQPIIPVRRWSSVVYPVAGLGPGMNARTTVPAQPQTAAWRPNLKVQTWPDTGLNLNSLTAGAGNPNQ